jgi:hypothetical protein
VVKVAVPEESHAVGSDSKLRSCGRGSTELHCPGSATVEGQGRGLGGVAIDERHSDNATGDRLCRRGRLGSCTDCGRRRHGRRAELDRIMVRIEQRKPFDGLMLSVLSLLCDDCLGDLLVSKVFQHDESFRGLVLLE